ncbi:hypothetical protein QT343_25535 [Escherichia coli]|nr:hypothetical protein [Escherichia coli]
MTVKSVVVLVMLWVSLRNNFAAFLGLRALPFKLAMNEGLSLYACVCATLSSCLSSLR